MTTSQLFFLAPSAILVLWMVFSHGGGHGGGHGMGGCGGGQGGSHGMGGCGGGDGHAGHGDTGRTKRKSPDHDHGTGATG